MTRELSKREQQVFDAITNEWSSSDHIVERIKGKRIYKRHIYSWLYRLTAYGLVEKSVVDLKPKWRRK